MYKINNIKLNVGYDENDLIKAVSTQIGGKAEEVKILKLSIDARKKPVQYVANVAVRTETSLNLPIYEEPLKSVIDVLPKTPPKQQKAIVIGMGPCGIFAALTLSAAGVAVTILERGESVENRQKSVLNFDMTGQLNTESNIQFGEGGAGTFSDGKLNTGVNNDMISIVLNEFISHGANQDILYMSRPHIGTDVLKNVVTSMRKKLIEQGCDIRFNTRADGLIIENNQVVGVNAGMESFYGDAIVLAVGHSARDTYTMLHNSGVAMERKAFAVGARIEHSQEIINRAQYGVLDNRLPNAEYRLSHHTSCGRGCFSFCMCPGGYVMASTSAEGGIVTNGMSARKRDGAKANSGILVSVNTDDYGDGILAGIDYQRAIEEKAFALTQNYHAPTMTIKDFLDGTLKQSIDAYKPTYSRGVERADISQCLPSYITKGMREGIKAFCNKIRGFENGVLMAPETRSSAPVRILRNGECESNYKGLFPCGEGAGYAGGITSSAVDGIKVALAILNK